MSLVIRVHLSTAESCEGQLQTVLLAILPWKSDNAEISAPAMKSHQKYEEFTCIDIIVGAKHVIRSVCMYLYTSKNNCSLLTKRWYVIDVDVQTAKPARKTHWVVVPLSNTSCPALLTSKSRVPSPCPCVQLRKITSNRNGCERVGQNNEVFFNGDSLHGCL